MISRRSIVFVVVLFLSSLTLTACDDDGEPAAQAPAQGEPMQLRCSSTTSSTAGGRRRTRRCASSMPTWWASWSPTPACPRSPRKRATPTTTSSLQLLSKYPIHEPSGGDGLYAFIEVQPGFVVAFFNHHLDYVEWGANALRKGARSSRWWRTRTRCARLRSPTSFEHLAELTARGTRCSSRATSISPRAWTTPRRPWAPRRDRRAGAVARERGAVRARLPRHVSRDPPRSLAEPGITQDGTGERHRLRLRGRTLDHDRQPAGGREGWARRVDRRLALDVGSSRGRLDVRGHAGRDAGHGLGRRATADGGGDTITVAYNAPGSDDNEIAIVGEGGDPASPAQRLEAPGESGTTVRPDRRARSDGIRGVLSESEGAEVARVPFWLRDPDVDVVLTTDKQRYEAGSRSASVGPTALRTDGTGSACSMRRRRTRWWTTT